MAGKTNIVRWASGPTASLQEIEAYKVKAVTGLVPGIADLEQANRSWLQATAVAAAVASAITADADHYTGVDVNDDDTDEEIAQKLIAAICGHVPYEIAAGSIAGEKIADGAIITSKLGASSVTAEKMAANSVASSAIQSGSVTEAKLGANAVTAVKINALAVTTEKLNTKAVTADKLADNSVASTSIQSGAVTEAKIATNAVTGTKIANGAVTNAKIADGAVTSSKIEAGAVGATQLADSGVTSGSYGPTAAATLAFGGTFYVPQVTFDEKGRATKAVHWALKIPAAPTSVSGNAGTATKLATKRTISATGDATWSASFDGSANASAALTLASVNDTDGTFGPSAAATLAFGGTFYVPQITVDAKGRVTLSKHWALKLPAAPAFATQAEAEAGTSSTKYMSPLRTKQAIDKLASTVPPGTMIHFAGKTLPDGWLICNGAAVSRTTYADLFKAIGTTYGTGDGSTTFNLPNAGGRFLECTTSTSQVGTKVEAGLPNITGAATQRGGSWYQAGDYTGCMYSNRSDTEDSGGAGHNGVTFYIDASRSSSVFDNSSTVQPASLRVLILIKA